MTAPATRTKSVASRYVAGDKTVSFRAALDAAREMLFTSGPPQEESGSAASSEKHDTPQPGNAIVVKPLPQVRQLTSTAVPPPPPLPSPPPVQAAQPAQPALGGRTVYAMDAHEAEDAPVPLAVPPRLVERMLCGKGCGAVSSREFCAKDVVVPQRKRPQTAHPASKKHTLWHHHHHHRKPPPQPPKPAAARKVKPPPPPEPTNVSEFFRKRSDMMRRPELLVEGRSK